MKRPAFQFYPGDWLNDAALRMVSVGARGLWIEMICLMHQGEPYGHLKVNDKVITEVQLTRMVGASHEEVKTWLAELGDAGVMSLTDGGCIYSRRMVRDEELRAIRADGGKQGGNPKLMGGYNKPGFVYAMLRSSDGAVKVGISQDPSKRLYKIRAQFPGDEITVLAKLWVEDMGATEAGIHSFFSSKKDGEWLSLNAQEIALLLDFHLKVNDKANHKVSQTPSSSSSSSSSSSNTENQNNTPPITPPFKNPNEEAQKPEPKKKAPKQTIDAKALALPEFLLPHKKLWDGWVDVRKLKSIPDTENAINLSIIRLKRLKDEGFDPGDVLTFANEKAWAGIDKVEDELKRKALNRNANNRSQGGYQKPMSTREMIEARHARREKEVSQVIEGECNVVEN